MRLGQYYRGSPLRSRNVLGHGICRPVFSHNGELVSVFVAGNIFADHLPGISPVIAFKNLVGCNIQAGWRMFAKDERGIPIPAIG